MKIFIILSLSILLTAIGDLKAAGAENDTIKVAFWNLENLFDTHDDPDKRDEEFLPGSRKDWTKKRLDKKLFNISRIVRMINPDIMGVCEVEHESLLDSLTAKFLSDKKYKIAYSESPDQRGIDNGLIYNFSKLKLLSINRDTVVLHDGYPTRIILNVNLVTNSGDTLIIFVNHWPSRWGGAKKSEMNRIDAAETLQKQVNKYLTANGNAKIIIIGDFNDNPDNRSISGILNAVPYICDSTDIQRTKDIQLYNLAYKTYSEGKGTIQYKKHWDLFDQVIISKDLAAGKSIKYICGSFQIFSPKIMVTRSGYFKGAPFPTYGGNKYLGGYSDHFPVKASFLIK